MGMSPAAPNCWRRVHGSVVLGVHVPGAIGRTEDRERTIDVGVAVVDSADRDISVRAELDGQVHHAIAIPADIPVARGRAEHGEVGHSVGSLEAFEGRNLPAPGCRRLSRTGHGYRPCR